jgi:TM2 domain-containing membrane protein YozV
MDCVTHSGAQAICFCQNCGKGICQECATASAMRVGARGMILCPACADAMQASQPAYAPPPPGSPNPAAAAVLGLIPGVGAMYNGQFFKGLIHVVVFAVLISISERYGIFGLFIAAWVLYQSFEAYHTARARRDGQPLPDPLGLNELGSWLNLGSHAPPAAPPFVPNGQQPPAQPYAQTPWQQTAQQPPYGAPFTPNPYAPPVPPPPVDPSIPPVSPIPPMPPVPPPHWRRREPVGAIVLIALGILFLMGQLDIFSVHLFKFTWPLMLIGLGVWLIIRRAGNAQGGPQ